MTAIAKPELERLERQYGLTEDGLTYQHRCSRITAYMKGEGDSWAPPVKEPPRIQEPPEIEDPINQVTTSRFKDHPLYGKRILITPLMTPDAKRNIAYQEVLGPEIITRDYNAGEHIYGADEDVQRMVGDYEIVSIDHTRSVTAKTTFPKIGTEISWKLGYELCPVVRGNDNKTGYIWSFPTSVVQIGDSLIQLYGLKTLIRQTYPELEEKFSGPKVMTYIDGVTLAASIPKTHAILKEFLRKERLAEKAGLGNGYGI